LFAPLLVDAGAFVEDLTDKVQTWRRSIRARRGPWLGTFRLYGDEPYLRKWFHEYLAFHIEERSQGITWEGLVWEMEYAHQGVTRRRSLDTVQNAVKAIYTDTADAVAESSWATQAQSLGLYGRMEEILIMDNYPQATAEGRRDKVLAERAWPWARPVGGRRGGDTYLDVSVAGYIFTANNKYVTSADGATGNASAWVSSIVSTDLQFLTAGKIGTNTFQMQRTLNVPQRAGDTLFEIAEIGDNSQVPWRFYADVGRVVHYVPFDTTPRYFLRNGEFYTSTSLKQTISPWEMEPGVIRDMDYPVRGPEQGSWLDDVRDILLEEITASENGVSWSTDDFSEAELLAAQQDYATSIGTFMEDGLL
jgi:hypothetical protein